MSKGLRQFISLVLICTVVVDVVLSTTAIFYPAMWFRVFHGAPYIDPQGLLRRTGAVWVAFSLLQLLAVFRWAREPWWLVLIAGVRLTELFSDWTYIYFAQSLTPYGRLGLFIAPPSNLALGWFFIWGYLKLTRGSASPPSV